MKKWKMSLWRSFWIFVYDSFHFFRHYNHIVLTVNSKRFISFELFWFWHSNCHWLWHWHLTYEWIRTTIPQTSPATDRPTKTSTYQMLYIFGCCCCWWCFVILTMSVCAICSDNSHDNWRNSLESGSIFGAFMCLHFFGIVFDKRWW